MLNKIQIIGRLGEAPELRQTTTGKAVCNFSVATSYKTAQKEEVEWHRIVVWDKLAENCKRYLDKGKLCYVEGRLTTKQYEKDGQKRSSTEIMAHQVVFLTPSSESKSTMPVEAPQNFNAEDWGDNIPF